MTIVMRRRMLYTPIFHIDTNLINARGKLDSMNQIEKWAIDGVVIINMSGVSLKEATADGNPARTRKAYTHIFTLIDEFTGPNDPLYVKIQLAIFPQGTKTENESNDVKIVYDAMHYAAVLVTRDGGSRTQPGGILGNRHKLRGMVKILSDTEAVAFVRENIAERDEFNRRVAHEYGGYLPEWTGKD